MVEHTPVFSQAPAAAFHVRPIVQKSHWFSRVAPACCRRCTSVLAPAATVHCASALHLRQEVGPAGSVHDTMPGQVPLHVDLHAALLGTRRPPS